MVTIKKYDELEEYIKAWCKSELKCNLIVLSDGGLGKTLLIKKYIGQNRFINSHITPLDLYLKFVENPNCDFWLQDVDLLLQNKLIVGLLKQAMEENRKIIQWNSTILPDDIPASIEITGRFIIELNQLTKGDKNLQALKTRCLTVDFKPTNLEIHTYLKRFAADQEIFEILDNVYPYVRNYNLRLFNTLTALKKANLNWKKTLFELVETIQLHSY